MANLYKSGIVITGDASSGLRVMNATEAQLKSLQATMGRTGGAAAKMNAATQGMYGSMTSLTGVIRQLAPAMGIFGASLAVKEIIGAAVAMEGYTRTLEAVTGGTAQAQSELKFLREEADRVGVAFQPMIREFAKLAAAAKNTSLEGDGVRQTFTAIVEISRVLNLSAEDTRGAIFAMQQMISKGVVSAEELRRQLGERLPGAFNAMARAVGKNTQELDKMLKAGSLITAEVLPKFNEELRKMAAPGLEAAMKMPAAEFARLQNVIFDLSVSTGNELMPALVDTAKVLVTILKAIQPLIGPLARLGIAFGVFKTIQPLLLGATAAMAAFRAEAALMGTAAAASGALYKTNTKLIGALGSALGGLPGILALAGGALWAYLDYQKQAKIAFDNTTESILAQRDAIADLGAAQARDLRDSASEQMAALSIEMDKLQNKVDQIYARRAKLRAQGLNPFHIDPSESDRIKDFNDEIARLALQWVGLSEVVKAAGERFDEASRPMTAAEIAAKEFAARAIELTGDLQRKIAGLDDTRDALIRYADETLAAATGEEEWYENLKKNRDILVGRLKEIEADKTAKEKAAKAQKELNDRIKDAGKLMLDLQKKMDPMLAAYMEYSMVAEELTQLQDELKLSDEALLRLLEALKLNYTEMLTPMQLLEQSNKKLIEDAKEQIVQLQFENAALELAIQNHEDLAIAKLRLAGADEELIKQFKEALEANKKLQEQYEQSEKSVDSLTAAVERGIERMDDAFATFWKNILKGGKNAFDSLKDLALDMVAEVIHILTTRRLVGAIASAFLPAGTAMAGGGIAQGGGMGQLWGGLVNMFSGGASGGGGMGGMGGLAGIGSLSGYGFGTALQTAGGYLPAYLGGPTMLGTTGVPIQGTGIFSQAGNVHNLAYAGYGIAGYALGDWIAPNTYANYGGSLGAIGGAAVGTSSAMMGATFGSWAGPVGAAIGAVIGIAIGALFKQREFEAALGGSNTRRAANNQTLTGPFGELIGLEGRGGWGDFAVKDSPAGQFGEAIIGFDTAVHDMLQAVGGAEYLDDITELMADWEGMWSGSALTLENVLTSRWNTMLEAFESDVVTFVKNAEDLEDQVLRLGMALQAQNIIGAAPELFSGRTWQDFIAVAQAMQEDGEEMTATFERLLGMVQQTAQAMAVLQAYGDSDLWEQFEKLTTAETQTLFQAGEAAAEKLRAAREEFDGSIDSLTYIAKLTAQRWELEIAMLLELKAIVEQTQSITNKSVDSIQAELDRIRDAGRTPEENYAFYSGLADSAAASLGGMTDPYLIAQTLEDINRWATTAFGFLGDDQKSVMGPEIQQFLQDVQDRANAQIDEVRQGILEESAAFREEMRGIADDIGDPLLVVANQLGISAEELSAAAAALTAAATRTAPMGPGEGGYYDADGNWVPLNSGGVSVKSTNSSTQGVETTVNVSVDATGVEGVVRDLSGTVGASARATALSVGRIESSINALVRALGTRSREVGGSLT